MRSRRIRALSVDELNVLTAVLALDAYRFGLPLQRRTEGDGPNEWYLCCWGIPQSLNSIGDVRIIEMEQADHEEHMKYRRPRVGDDEAEVTLELPTQLLHYRLTYSSRSGWSLRGD